MLGAVSTLKEPAYWILCALAGGEGHGYAVAQRVSVLSDDRVGIGPGTLYATLERLAGEGLIEQSRAEVVDGRNRRYYRLTGSGRRAVTDETERRSTAVTRARLALGLP